MRNLPDPRPTARLLRRYACAAVACVTICPTARAQSNAPLSTETFLNRLGVNTHLGGLTPGDPWNTDITAVAAQLRYLGVRIVRDWPSASDGPKWLALQREWSPYGRFWTSIDEGSPAAQLASAAAAKAIAGAYPSLICALGGPNEEDDDYARNLGATLPAAASLQRDLFTWAHGAGRDIKVSQMEFGAGWTSANDWQGDYNPANTGIHQPYAPGPADYAAAHTYLSNDQQLPVDVIRQLRTLAQRTTPGKPVAHTEFGAYRGAKLSPEEYAQFLVMGAFDSLGQGDVGYLVYGLQDSAPEQTYGFFAFPSGKPNPAADYFHTLTDLLASSPGANAAVQTSNFPPAALSVLSDNGAVSHLTLQKPTGEYIVAAWVEQRKPKIGAPPVLDHVHLGRRFSRIEWYDVESGEQVIDAVENSGDYSLKLTPNHLYLLILR